MKKNGFTLIELLVVIAIIGILGVLAVWALGTAKQKARDAVRLSDLKQLQNSLELYYGDKTDYPPGNGAVLGAGNVSCLNDQGWLAPGCANAYLPRVPADPQTPNHNYVYTKGANTYTITATLEGDVEGLTGAIKVSPTGIGK